MEWRNSQDSRSNSLRQRIGNFLDTFGYLSIYKCFQIHIIDLVVKRSVGVRKWLHAQAVESPHPVAYSARLSKGFLFIHSQLIANPAPLLKAGHQGGSRPAFRSRDLLQYETAQDSACRQLHIQLPLYITIFVNWGLFGILRQLQI